MAARATAGDPVYIHLSGHGTRQGDPEGDETDGLDEVFLPADTGRRQRDRQRYRHEALQHPHECREHHGSAQLTEFWE